MKTVKIEVDGKLYTLEIDDGVEITLADGKITVRAKPIYNPLWVNPWAVPMQPVTPPYEPFRITWGTNSASSADHAQGIGVFLANTA